MSGTQWPPAGGVIPRIDEYSTAGTFTWTCPADVYVVDEVEVIGSGAGGENGSGGSGASPGNGGRGGGVGERIVYGPIKVTPGTGYAIVVGAGAVANGAGSDSSAFGIIALGGAIASQQGRCAGGRSGAGGKWGAAGGGTSPGPAMVSFDRGQPPGGSGGGDGGPQTGGGQWGGTGGTAGGVGTAIQPGAAGVTGSASTGTVNGGPGGTQSSPTTVPGAGGAGGGGGGANAAGGTVGPGGAGQATRAGCVRIKYSL